LPCLFLTFWSVFIFSRISLVALYFNHRLPLLIVANMCCPFVPLLFVCAIPGAVAWGTVGHATVATIANNVLTSEASDFVSSILGSGTSMASVASWADSYRYTSAGSFSSPFHYIDAEDSPPSSCGVKLSRNCGSEGCIVSAIANYVGTQFLYCLH